MKLRAKLERLWPDLVLGKPKAVHEARKLTRKAGAELRLQDAPKKVRRAWRDLRRAVAGVRDHDAAGEHLREGLRELGASKAELASLNKTWKAERAKMWAEVKLQGPPPDLGRPKDFGELAARRRRKDWKKLAREAEEALSHDDPAVWHGWRKRLKAYRYTLELDGKAPQKLLDLLRALGRLQDAQVARAVLMSHPNLLPERREALLAREEQAARESMARARELWPQVQKEQGA